MLFKAVNILLLNYVLLQVRLKFKTWFGVLRRVMDALGKLEELSKINRSASFISLIKK